MNETNLIYLTTPKWFCSAIEGLRHDVVKGSMISLDGDEPVVFTYNIFTSPKLKHSLYNLYRASKNHKRYKENLRGGDILAELQYRINEFMAGEGYPKDDYVTNEDMVYFWFTTLRFIFGEEALQSRGTYLNRIGCQEWRRERERWLDNLRSKASWKITN